MALGNDDSGADEDNDLDGSGVSGDDLFNRCINNALEAQEVRYFLSSLSPDAYQIFPERK